MEKENFISKIFKLDIKTIAIIVLVIILLLKNCGGGINGSKDVEQVKINGKKYDVLSHTIDTVFVEKIVKVPTYVPKYITKIETVEVPADVDTTEILRNYFATYEVVDTLKLVYDFPENVKDSVGNKPNSSLGFGVLKDKISQNSIISRDILWNFTIPTIYDTKIVKEPAKTQLYYGVNMGLNKEDVISTTSAGLILKTKKDHIYQLNIGVSNSTNGVIPFIGGGLYWKINLNKNK